MQQVPATAQPGQRGLVATVAAGAAWLALLYAFRFGFMEIEAEADPCLNDPLGAVCRARAVIGDARVAQQAIHVDETGNRPAADMPAAIALQPFFQVHFFFSRVIFS